jgi:7,8-dihydroneopterin 2',3'-cyclic phosphate phosphodiesterase
LGWNVSFVKHCNSAVRGALSLATLYKEEYGININFDILIAAALLHDVDKMLIYERKGERVEMSELGQKLRHGVYGAHAALDEGLPLEVAHVIATHSPQSGAYPTTVEGAIIQYADLADMEAALLSSGRPRRTRPVSTSEAH